MIKFITCKCVDGRTIYININKISFLCQVQGGEEPETDIIIDGDCCRRVKGLATRILGDIALNATELGS